MKKTATLNLRVDMQVKAQAESVLSKLGLSTTNAIELYLRQIIYTQSIPFPLTLHTDKINDNTEQ